MEHGAAFCRQRRGDGSAGLECGRKIVQSIFALLMDWGVLSHP